MKRNYYLFAVLIILIMGLIVVVKSQNTPGFSIVYFDNATIPDYVVPNVTYTVTFIIESHEHSPESYHYIVYLDGAVIDDGNVFLVPSKIAQVSFNFSVKRATYRRLMLWERNTTYNLTGVWAILGEPLGNSTKVSTASPGYSLPTYFGPSNLSFLLNTTRNVTIVRTIKERDTSSTRVTEYKLAIIPLGDEKYKVTVQESRFTYIPNPVVIKVVVTSTNGESYQILRHVPLRED